ncbi:MAG: beta-N-acetylglucosaminidase domain-containing protein, partial [Chloroflexi bacterium]|nr:beta-N-acetylglucosaminidase domain-containing protein [Chloroflexota bacterium]
GVIEGFYDRLWTWDERERFAQAVGALGFTHYVWAPKEDRLQNAGWRTPYPDDERRRLAAFAEARRRNGMSPWFGLRPVGFSYADDADAERVVEKLRDHVELGAAGILLLADDIPASLDAAAAGRFADLAGAHAWLVGRVARALGAAPLAFCPTEYHGSGGTYLHRLGAAVPLEVDLCWTGPEVCSPAISADEARGIGTVLGRRPLIWDNYPVNDAAMTGELHIGPIRDRDVGLAELTAGIWVNPAMEPEASLVPMATWADYLDGPSAYDPDTSWARALRRIAGSAADAGAVAALAAHADRSVIRQPWRRPAGASVDPAAYRAASVANDRLATDLRRFVDALPAQDG